MASRKAQPISDAPHERGVDRARLFMDIYGVHLQLRRKAAELTLRELTEETGIPASDLTRIENARMIPTVEQQEILRQWLLKHPLPDRQPQ